MALVHLPRGTGASGQGATAYPHGRNGNLQILRQGHGLCQESCAGAITGETAEWLTHAGGLWDQPRTVLLRMAAPAPVFSRTTDTAPASVPHAPAFAAAVPLLAAGRQVSPSMAAAACATVSPKLTLGVAGNVAVLWNKKGRNPRRTLCNDTPVRF